MSQDVNFKTFQSPFSWRYGSLEMRQIFSEENRRLTWRQVWVALAKAQFKEGLLTKPELDDIVKNSKTVDIQKALEIEAEIKHDLMAELKTFAAASKIGGGKIHLGATSQDIEDNADALIYKNALEKIEQNLKKLLSVFAQKIDANKDLVCMAYTHLQPAEPTTLGYRFSFYAQDLLLDLELLKFVKNQIKGKGLKGAVGTSASYFALLSQKAENLEKNALSELGIEAFDIATQVYPRKLDFLILTVLSSIAQSLNKLAFDLRILQSAGFGEVQEPFGQKQVGSSAMPFKRNPQSSERICSLARFIAAQLKVAWDNAANSLLERTLDDSASRRIILPESFLAADEILSLAIKILDGLVINQKNIEKNLELYGPFSAMEGILMQAVKNGADRQKMHEVLRNIAISAYEKIQNDGNNTLLLDLQNNKDISQYLSADELKKALEYKKHIGNAPGKSALMVQKITKAL